MHIIHFDAASQKYLIEKQQNSVLFTSIALIRWNIPFLVAFIEKQQKSVLFTSIAFIKWNIPFSVAFIEKQVKPVWFILEI